jgi:hypothetical protein
MITGLKAKGYDIEILSASATLKPGVSLAQKYLLSDVRRLVPSCRIRTNQYKRRRRRSRNVSRNHTLGYIF